MAANTINRTMVWCRFLLRRLDEEKTEATVIHKDYMACVSFSMGEGLFQTSTHTGFKCQYLKEQIDCGEIMLKYVSAEEQLADLLAKTVASVEFNKVFG